MQSGETCTDGETFVTSPIVPIFVMSDAVRAADAPGRVVPETLALLAVGSYLFGPVLVDDVASAAFVTVITLSAPIEETWVVMESETPVPIADVMVSVNAPMKIATTVSVVRSFDRKVFELAGCGVEVSGRFIRKDHARVVDESTGDHHPLLLTAGGVVRVALRLIDDAEDLQGLERLPLPLAPTNSRDLEWRGHVVYHGGVRGEEELLVGRIRRSRCECD